MFNIQNDLTPFSSRGSKMLPSRSMIHLLYARRVRCAGIFFFSNSSANICLNIVLFVFRSGLSMHVPKFHFFIRKRAAVSSSSIFGRTKSSNSTPYDREFIISEGCWALAENYRQSNQKSRNEEWLSVAKTQTIVHPSPSTLISFLPSLLPPLQKKKWLHQRPHVEYIWLQLKIMHACYKAEQRTAESFEAWSFKMKGPLCGWVKSM